MKKLKNGLKIVAAALTISVCLALPAYAQGADDSKISFIRDAEIENYLRSLATPIYRAAEIDPNSVTIAIVNSSAINAFVAEGMNEFFYTGLLQATDTPEQLAGVIAHETGHISGGHLIRGKKEMKNASAEAMLGTLIAIVAGAATGKGDLAMGGLAGSAQLAERGFLKFSRAQESSADSAAVSFLDRAGMSSKGLEEFFDKLAGQEMLPQDRQEEYVRTHPLTQDRISGIKHHVENSSKSNEKLPEKFYVMHERMKAKLLGYLQPETALLRYSDKDPRISARYARSIALYRTGKPDRAIALIDELIKQEPDNAFFYETKAQIQLENSRIEESIKNYKKANELLPNSALLKQAYGHALLESREPDKKGTRIDMAIQHLIEANRLESRMPMTWRFLASAWGRKAELTKDKQYEAMATYALAEESSAKGNDKAASQLADRAMRGLPKGSTYWLRAQDIKLSLDRDEDREKDKDRLL